MSVLYRTLQLDKARRERVEQWLQGLRQSLKEARDSCIEESLESDAPVFTITAYDGGITDVLYVETVVNGQKYVCHLTYDDDGNLI